jgi:molecular chaperone GrpE
MGREQTMVDEKTAGGNGETSPDQLPETYDEEKGLAPVPADDDDVLVIDADAVEAEGMPSEVDELRAEMDRLRDLYLRKLAEFDNFRKRTDREKNHLEITAGENLLVDLVPVLDNFERALSQPKDVDPEGFYEGVEMIARQLWEVLDRKGMRVINPEGEHFDPEFHEAVQRVEEAGVAPGTVVSVLTRGYEFCGRLLRPAMVGVAVEAASPAPAGPLVSREGEESSS